MGIEFSPPYIMFGKCIVLISLFKKSNELWPNNVYGYSPLSIFGFSFGMIIINAYEAPSKETMPYDEVIYSLIYRNGFRFKFIPFFLELNDEFQVHNGIKYYSLPKQYNVSIKLTIEQRCFNYSGSSFIGGRFCHFILNVFAFPFLLLLNLSTRFLTKIILIIGIDHKPYKKAFMNIMPAFLKYKICKQVKVKAKDMSVNTLFSVYWPQTKSIINKPTNFKGTNE